MSRRLRTLVRVAELKEAAARRAAADALAAAGAARAQHAADLATLHAGGVAGGSREALTASHRLQLVRADEVAVSAARADQAEGAQRAAVQAWTETRRRQRLLAELLERGLEAERVRREKHEQLLADELAASRLRADQGGRR